MTVHGDDDVSGALVGGPRFAVLPARIHGRSDAVVAINTDAVEAILPADNGGSAVYTATRVFEVRMPLGELVAALRRADRDV